MVLWFLSIYVHLSTPQSAEHPKWMILLKSVAYLTVGVIMVCQFNFINDIPHTIITSVNSNSI